MKKAHRPFTRMVEIIWNDAASNDGWIAPDDDTTPEQVVSIGWIIKDASDYITIAAAIHVDNKAEVGSTQTIPVGMIVSRKELKVVNVRSHSQDKLHSKPTAKEIHREPGKG